MDDKVKLVEAVLKFLTHESLKGKVSPTLVTFEEGHQTLLVGIFAHLTGLHHIHTVKALKSLLNELGFESDEAGLVWKHPNPLWYSPRYQKVVRELKRIATTSRQYGSGFGHLVVPSENTEKFIRLVNEATGEHFTTTGDITFLLLAVNARPHGTDPGLRGEVWELPTLPEQQQ